VFRASSQAGTRLELPQQTAHETHERSVELEQKKDPKTDSLTACVAHVLGVDASEVPCDGGVRLNQWLAARNLGLVPVEAPQSFKWPGRFLGLRSRSSTWAVFFGVSPGVVYDPVAETDGRSPEGPPEGADVALKGAFVVAEHDLLRGIGPGRRSESTGTVEVIALAAEAESPMTVVPSVEAVENRGLVGDRYERGEGTFSDPNGRGYDLTLVEAEALEELAAKEVELSPAKARRNLVVRGVALDDLIGKRFRVGEVECFGQRRCEPCAHLERLTRPGVLRGLVHRGGLRADVLSSGEIHTGDSVEALP
jgi:MOSC domain-containing protein YiiM